MKQRNVGNSGVKVSLLGLGCNNFGLRMPVEDSRAVIEKALDLGITFFDTADVYGKRGGSETALGKYLGSRSKDVFIASKFGNPMDDEGKLRGGSRSYVKQAVEASLKRLQRDWIDLYQMHRPDPAVPIEETLRALDECVRQGKIRYIGFSQLAGWELADRHWIAKHCGLVPVTAVEIEYSLLNRDPERELVPAMREYGVGLLPFYPLASGFLTGKYRRGAPPPEGRAAHAGHELRRSFHDRVQLGRAREAGSVLRRARTHPARACALLARGAAGDAERDRGRHQGRPGGAQREAIEWELEPEELAEIDGITGRPPASGRTQRRTP
jgi:aryl-alcohol dehydrogenase-like predicted oxidoreductase